MSGLTLRPCTLREANAFVAEHHRHHQPTRGHRWSLACALGGQVVGVAIAGRPVSRHLDDGTTLEVLRVATDGTPNACSFLLAAVARTARAMGYRKVLTYTLTAETGASLRAVGWRAVHTTKAEGWGRPSRDRDDRHPTEAKTRWEWAA